VHRLLPLRPRRQPPLRTTPRLHRALGRLVPRALPQREGLLLPPASPPRECPLRRRKPLRRRPRRRVRQHRPLRPAPTFRSRIPRFRPRRFRVRGRQQFRPRRFRPRRFRVRRFRVRRLQRCRPRRCRPPQSRPYRLQGRLPRSCRPSSPLSPARRRPLRRLTRVPGRYPGPSGWNPRKRARSSLPGPRCSSLPPPQPLCWSGRRPRR
jgi:hypothetical protein